MARDEPWHGRDTDRKVGGPRYLLALKSSELYIGSAIAAKTGIQFWFMSFLETHSYQEASNE
jgi:hypothetical protein